MIEGIEKKAGVGDGGREGKLEMCVCVCERTADRDR